MSWWRFLYFITAALSTCEEGRDTVTTSIQYHLQLVIAVNSASAGGPGERHPIVFFFTFICSVVVFCLNGNRNDCSATLQPVISSFSYFLVLILVAAACQCPTVSATCKASVNLWPSMPTVAYNVSLPYEAGASSDQRSGQFAWCSAF